MIPCFAPLVFNTAPMVFPVSFSAHESLARRQQQQQKLRSRRHRRTTRLRLHHHHHHHHHHQEDNYYLYDADDGRVVVRKRDNNSFDVDDELKMIYRYNSLRQILQPEEEEDEGENKDSEYDDDDKGKQRENMHKGEENSLLNQATGMLDRMMDQISWCTSSSHKDSSFYIHP